MGYLPLRDFANATASVLVLLPRAGRVAEQFIDQRFRQHIPPPISGHLGYGLQQPAPPARGSMGTRQPLGSLSGTLWPISAGEFGDRQKQPPQVSQSIIESGRKE